MFWPKKKAFRFQLVFIGVGELRSFFYRDTKFVCHIPNTDEPFTVVKYEKVLGRAYPKMIKINSYFDQASDKTTIVLMEI